MSFNSPLLMSGAFHLDVTNNGGGARGSSLSGVHPGIFRPPSSPSASPTMSNSYYLGRSTGSLQSDIPTPMQNVKRKRPGLGTFTPMRDWAMADDGNFNTDSIMEDRSDFNPSTNEKTRRYVLAGQIETPNGAEQKELGNIEDSIYSDVDYRRGLGSQRPLDDLDSGNQTSTSWSLVNTIGGVVGRVLEFCRFGAFRGFYAGGGRGYEISGETPRQQPIHQIWTGHPQRSVTPERDPSPIFQSLPRSNYSPFHHERETPEDTSPLPAAKRRQLSYGTPNDELQKNWVMISESENATRQPSFASLASSRRPVSRTAAPPLTRRISKPVSRLQAPTLNRHPPSRPSPAASRPMPDREPASFASPRSPVASSTARSQTPSRIPVPSRSQSPATFASASFAQKPSRIPHATKHGHQRSNSAISATSAPSVAHVKMPRRDSLQDNSPRLDAQARSLAAKRMQEEMEVDYRITDFNARLRDMIRQGKEALGTTYEVDGAGDAWESD